MIVVVVVIMIVMIVVVVVIMIVMIVVVVFLKDMLVVMTFIRVLHSLDDLLLHRIHMIHHHDGIGSLLFKGIKDTLDPKLHGTAVGDQDIGILDHTDILWRRLKRMAVHPGRNHHGKLHTIPCNLTHKIIVWKERCHHLESSASGCGLCFIFFIAAAFHPRCLLHPTFCLRRFRTAENKGKEEQGKRREGESSNPASFSV